MENIAMVKRMVVAKRCGLMVRTSKVNLKIVIFGRGADILSMTMELGLMAHLSLENLNLGKVITNGIMALTLKVNSQMTKFGRGAGISSMTMV